MSLLGHLLRPRALLLASLVTSLVAVGLALVSQHVFGMEPCPWCVLQRLIFVAIAVVCGLGLLWTSSIGRRLASVMVLALGLSGVAAAAWQHFVAAASNSCNLTLADKIISGLKVDSLMPEVFSPRASCADAAVNLLGIPYEFWSLGLFALIGIGAIKMLIDSAR